MEVAYDWAKVERALALRQMTKQELADAIGVSRQTLYKMQSGTHSFRRANAMAIAYALDIQVEELEAEAELVSG